MKKLIPICLSAMLISAPLFAQSGSVNKPASSSSMISEPESGSQETSLKKEKHPEQQRMEEEHRGGPDLSTNIGAGSGTGTGARNEPMGSAPTPDSSEQDQQ